MSWGPTGILVRQAAWKMGEMSKPSSLPSKSKAAVGGLVGCPQEIQVFSSQ